MLIVRSLFILFIIIIFILAVLPDYRGLPEVFSLSALLNHIAAFVALTVLGVLSRFSFGHRFLAALLLMYGVLIEGVQYLLPTRYFSLEDVVADALGVALGLVLLKLSGYLEVRDV